MCTVPSSFNPPHKGISPKANIFSAAQMLTLSKCTKHCAIPCKIPRAAADLVAKSCCIAGFRMACLQIAGLRATVSRILVFQGIVFRAQLIMFPATGLSHLYSMPAMFPARGSYRRGSCNASLSAHALCPALCITYTMSCLRSKISFSKNCLIRLNENRHHSHHQQAAPQTFSVPTPAKFQHNTQSFFPRQSERYQQHMIPESTDCFANITAHSPS